MNASQKYNEAIELYRTTDLSVTEISRRCGVTRSGLAGYIQRCHRDLMYKRHGVEPKASAEDRMRRGKGQSPQTRAKYKEAIDACDSEEYIDLNVSQIARLFGLDGTALASQLRAHYPDIIPRREAERRRRGIADNVRRGARQTSVEEYADAVELLSNTDYTIEQVAEICGVSYSGLKQYLIFYNKKLMEKRESIRATGKEIPRIGHVSGNGKVREASPDKEAYYREAVEMYKSTSLPMKEIARLTGVELAPFRHYMRMWHRKLIFERRGADPDRMRSDREGLTGTRNYSKASAEKYEEAISLLRSSDMSTEAVARKFGFIPEVFRMYLKEHCPDLYESMGMIRLPDGRKVLKRSYDRYSEAIRLFSTTTEPLRSIADRLKIQYNSIGGFIRRNYPELIEEHNRLVEDEEKSRREKRENENTREAKEMQEQERERIISALRQTDGNRIKAAALLGISKSTLYNRLRSLGIR